MGYYKSSSNNSNEFFNLQNSGNKEALQKEEKENNNVVNISTDEHKYISSKLDNKAEVYNVVDFDDMFFISSVGKPFHVTAWEATGIVNITAIRKNINKLISDNPQLRTGFLFRNVSYPVKFITKYSEKVYPITDLRNVPQNKQVVLLQNIVAAETRRVYDPEKDDPFGVSIYMISKDRIVMVVSTCRFLSNPSDLRLYAVDIFSGMKLENNTIISDSDISVKHINKEIVSKSIVYWNKLVKNVGKPLLIPGEINDSDNFGEISNLYLSINNKIIKKLNAFCTEKNVSLKSLFCVAWARLLGIFNGEKRPVIPVFENGEKLDVMLLPVDLNENNIDSMNKIDKIIGEFADYSICEYYDIKNNLCIPNDQFHFALRFFKENSFNSISDFVEKSSKVLRNLYSPIDVSLEASVVSKNEEVGINYIYNSASIFTSNIEKIHVIFEKVLETLFEFQKSFDKNDYISESDSDAEKLRKIEVAQIALFIKNTGLFDMRSPDDFMSLAAKGKLSVYPISFPIIKENSPQEYVGIVSEGKVEETKMDLEGIVNTIRVLKPGDIMSTKCFGENNNAPCAYSAIDDGTKVVWIKNEDMISFLNENPACWLNMFNYMEQTGNVLRKLITLFSS